MPPVRKRGSPLESSSSTEPPVVRAGRLGRPTGLKGFLGLYVEDEDLVYFDPGSMVLVGERALSVRAIRRGAKGHEVAFTDIMDRESAESIRGSEVFVAERRSLAEGEYWPEDLIGLDVRPGGGQVVDVVHGPAQDRLVVERDGQRFEVPFVDELVPVVDIDGGHVEVVEIEGLS